MAALLADERFTVGAPPAAVWAFLVDPRCVVGCVPGGELGAVLDERTFEGAVRVAVGPLTLPYAGRVRLAEVDAGERRVKIVGEARERAGTDTARLTLASRVLGPDAGPTEVVAHVRLELAGRIVELGRGVLEPLAHLVFQEFASAVRATIEGGEARRRAGLAASAPPPRAAPLRALPLFLRALRAWLASWISSRLLRDR